MIRETFVGEERAEEIAEAFGRLRDGCEDDRPSYRPLWRRSTPRRRTVVPINPRLTTIVRCADETRDAPPVTETMRGVVVRRSRRDSQSDHGRVDVVVQLGDELLAAPRSQR